jgi:HSP20 family protein
MANKDMTTRNDEIRAPQRAIRPAVDIYETEQGLTMLADLPGVAKDGLSIDIDQGVLTLRGDVGSTGRGDSLHREFALGSYYRRFTLPDELDFDKVTAELKDGVLTLTMPKAEAAKPRRIEVVTH